LGLDHEGEDGEGDDDDKDDGSAAISFNGVIVSE